MVNLDYSKQQESADDNSKSDKDGCKFSKIEENTVENFSFFPPCFQRQKTADM